MVGSQSPACLGAFDEDEQTTDLAGCIPRRRHQLHGAVCPAAAWGRRGHHVRRSAEEPAYTEGEREGEETVRIHAGGEDSSLLCPALAGGDRVACCRRRRGVTITYGFAARTASLEAAAKTMSHGGRFEQDEKPSTAFPRSEEHWLNNLSGPFWAPRLARLAHASSQCIEWSHAGNEQKIPPPLAQAMPSLHVNNEYAEDPNVPIKTPAACKNKSFVLLQKGIEA